MAKYLLSGVSALMLIAAPAAAQNKEENRPEKPITQQDISAEDVVATPATDLNIKKNEVPALLISAQERPYALRGLSTCQQLAAAIGELDEVLGDDVDVPQTEGRRIAPGRVAQSVVGSLIPFRGLIREISGANAQDRALQAAIIAGVARRSFLKGIGQGKGCRYPARSATLEVFNHRMAAINAGLEPWKPSPVEAEPHASPQSQGEPRALRYVSRPVVQQAE